MRETICWCHAVSFGKDTYFYDKLKGEDLPDIICTNKTQTLHQNEENTLYLKNDYWHHLHHFSQTEMSTFRKPALLSKENFPPIFKFEKNGLSCVKKFYGNISFGTLIWSLIILSRNIINRRLYQKELNSVS